MSESAASIRNVIVGTAGHIDHGKSSLVRALTGIDPDRLREEKERGMTIDLGFARYRGAGERLVGIIDVPGHERFIKNMVAGATSVDVVVLVVAADDGVMPQTIEHLEILTLLGLERGMVVVNKSDLVDEDLLELAIEDVRSLVASTFLRDAKILPCSAITQAGLTEVKAELDRLIEEAPPRSEEGLFRLPIQRVFSAKGHGTVITGVPLSGAVSIGDEVEVLPLGRVGRVRGIQAYGTSQSIARAGHSCALNVGDLDFHEIARGMTAAAPGFFRAADLFEARLRYLGSCKEPLEHRSQVKVHLGTAEIMGRVLVLDHERLLPGEEGLVQLELEEPVVAASGDRFLIRLPSPAQTLGGGEVLGAARHHRKRLRDHHVTALQDRLEALDDPLRALRIASEARRFEPHSAHDLAVDVSATEDRVAELLPQLVAKKQLVDLGRGQFLSARFAGDARKRILERLQSLHDKHPLKKRIEIRELRSGLDLPERVLKELLALLVHQGAVAEEGAAGHFRLSSHKPALGPEEEKLLDEMRAAWGEAKASPPSLAQFAEKSGAAPKVVERLAELLVDEEEFQRIGTLYFHRPAVEHARDCLIRNAQAHDGEVAIPDLRDELGTSRKYMIPLLEYFDTTGITVRRGDRRLLRQHKV